MMGYIMGCACFKGNEPTLQRGYGELDFSLPVAIPASCCVEKGFSGLAWLTCHKGNNELCHSPFLSAITSPSAFCSTQQPQGSLIIQPAS